MLIFPRCAIIEYSVSVGVVQSKPALKRFSGVEVPFQLTETCTVTVSCVETAFEFYVQRSDESLAGKFRTMHADMQLFYARKSNLPEPALRAHAACVYQDAASGEWHRAKIVYVHNADHVIVLLVDSGETRYVNRASLRDILDKYLVLSCRASLAALGDIYVKRDTQLDENLHQMFKELALNRTFTAKVTQIVPYDDIETTAPQVSSGDDTSKELPRTKLLLNLFDDESGESLYSRLVESFDTSNVAEKFRPRLRSKLEETVLDLTMNDTTLNAVGIIFL